MSRRAKQQQPPQPAAAVAGSSRRTRRAELPRSPSPAPGLAETPHQIVSNPIFRCEAGPSQPNSRPPRGDQLRCVYGPGSLYARVHDPAPVHDMGIGKAPQQPLPLPPCRAHPSVRVGPAAHAVGGPHGRVLRRPAHDPFLAAYVACSKSAAAGGGKDATGGDEVVDRSQHKQRRRKGKKAAGKKCKEREVMFRGCGMIWSGWTAGAKYAGAMSCRYGCAVAGHKGDATATKSEDDAPAGPTLDLSWTPAVLSARALERRQQR